MTELSVCDLKHPLNKVRRFVILNCLRSANRMPPRQHFHSAYSASAAAPPQRLIVINLRSRAIRQLPQSLRSRTTSETLHTRSRREPLALPLGVDTLIPPVLDRQRHSALFLSGRRGMDPPCSSRSGRPHSPLEQTKSILADHVKTNAQR